MSTKFPADFITVGVGSVSFNAVADNGGKILRATGGNRTNLYICNTMSNLSDVEVIAKIKNNNINAHQGGIVLRYVDVDNYYVFRNLGPRIQIGKVVAGRFILIISVFKSLSSDIWYWFRLRALGTALQFEFSTDGVNYDKELFWHDSEFSSGKAGFYANNRNAAGVIDFDNTFCNSHNPVAY
jgi:hypothetical protein